MISAESLPSGTMGAFALPLALAPPLDFPPLLAVGFLVAALDKDFLLPLAEVLGSAETPSEDGLAFLVGRGVVSSGESSEASVMGLRCAASGIDAEDAEETEDICDAPVFGRVPEEAERFKVR